MNRNHLFKIHTVYLWITLCQTQYCSRSHSSVQSGCSKAITRLIASYHYYWRCRIDWLSAVRRQTGTHWVVISFNSSWIAQRCVFWKVCSACMCECVWGYEAALLFLGQLLVTQEWLICNGCCHSPAAALGDEWSSKHTHTRIRVLTLIHLHTKNHPFCQYSVSTPDKLSSTTHQSSHRWQIDKWSWIHPITFAPQQTGFNLTLK